MIRFMNKSLLISLLCIAGVSCGFADVKLGQCPVGNGTFVGSNAEVEADYPYMRKMLEVIKALMNKDDETAKRLI